LQLCEARLRLEAFVCRFESGPPAAGPPPSGAPGVGRRGGGARGGGSGRRDAVLAAFVAAVRQVLRMQAAALQVLSRRAAAGSGPRGVDAAQPPAGGLAARRRARGGGSAPVGVRGAGDAAPQAQAPPLTLAELAVVLADVATQLRDLSRLCRCGAAPAPVRADAHTPRAGGAAAAPSEAPEALPWPGELAAWAAAWGWGPSVWQVAGFVSGLQVLDGLYAGGPWGAVGRAFCGAAGVTQWRRYGQEGPPSKRAN
jgi:hypothetical protein